jgi:hypothetical protein|tara:strand:- start:1782 stop:2246 length:465 start_codon:yes stop_codon:yes gene_type:complete
MNKNAREKQLLEEAYSQVLGEQSESKAPKGDSFDSEKNYKPSGVDAGSDGSGGRYRRIRINKPGRSKETHGGRGVQDEEQPRDSMYLKDDPEALKKALEYHRRNVAKLRRKSMLDLTDEEYDSLKHSEGELELNEGEEHPEEDELEALIAAEND